MEQKSVYDMDIGEKGVISDLLNFDIKTRHRFLDLGIAPQSKITLLNRVNFKHLYLIEVDDVEFCIRKVDAKNVIVTIE
ncbi:FeoA family protein [Haloplasma contractile]|uniref:FeoA domain protein n=1 Tax=Haloplasma contractile SSD-17B TaxID=1033810 RepID=U2FR26_9MOLU|nr:FeoA family protein [Haloplasma contractile]ERJ13449.1 FeoA domain protein [Haloplasma contractile SSD-17B]